MIIFDCTQTAAITSVQMAIESSHVTQRNLDQSEIVSILTKNVTGEMIVIMPKMNLTVFSWLISRKGIDGLFVRE